MSDVSYDFVTDRLAVGNVASRAVPGFVAVVSLLSTAPWDELAGAPEVPQQLVHQSLPLDWRLAEWEQAVRPDRTSILHVDIGDGETRKVHPGNGEHYGHDLDEYLDDATYFIAAHVRRGCVLVHCGAGKSRSVAVVVAYLCRYAGMSYAEALTLVKARRPGAAPCDAFAAAVKRWLQLDELAAKGPRR